MESVKKIKYLWEDGNEIEWIQAFIKIVDKNAKLVPFILTPEQRKFVEGLCKYIIVLKSRQLGLSVCTVALSIRQCMYILIVIVYLLVTIKNLVMRYLIN
jgi:hypothetical protein